MRYYRIEVAGKTVYACTDPHRFVREAQKMAEVANAVLIFPHEGDK